MKKLKIFTLLICLFVASDIPVEIQARDRQTEASQQPSVETQKPIKAPSLTPKLSTSSLSADTQILLVVGFIFCLIFYIRFTI